MVKLLQSKNSATRFQIMVEIAAGGGNTQQRSIASRLRISPQAVSDYMGQLEKDGLVNTTGRSSFKVTDHGVNWMLKMLRELNNYISLAQKAVTDISISAAVAECNLQEGQTVSLIMKGGLLFATKEMKQGAKGIAISSVSQGEDVGVAKIEGFIKLTKGEVTVLSVPDIQQGGSKQVDLEKLKVEIGEAKQVGAIGIEALVALRRVGTDARYFYGVREAATQAAQHGSPFIVICTSSYIPSLLQGLEENNLRYTVRDVRLDRPK